MKKSKLYFATEVRFIKRDGVYYSFGGSSKDLWKRYLLHFDEIKILARVTYDSQISIASLSEASCEGVEFIELPYYVGLWGYLRQRASVKRKIRNSISSDGYFICRLPGRIGGLVIDAVKSIGAKYACEVAGNPWDVFSKGNVQSPLRALIRMWSTFELKRQLLSSSAALYVTEHTLQKSYPVREGIFSVGVSDVIVKDDTMALSAKFLQKKKLYRLVSVGSLEQMYKAPDIVLRALREVNDFGIACELVWLGDGKLRAAMQALSCELGIQDKVYFKGNVSSSQVIIELQKADIFLLVSRTEGLPRALIEAMAQGLPCIGSRVGGIPELLPEECLVEKESVEELSTLISSMLTDFDFSNRCASRNLSLASNYRESVLAKKRDSFFDAIKRG